MTSRAFLPYGRQDIDESDIAAVAEALRSDFLTTGPGVEAFEQAFAAAVEAPFAVACSNGTAALHLAMLGITALRGPGPATGWLCPRPPSCPPPTASGSSAGK